MGYRTVVVHANDDQHNWEQDPELGKKIAKAAAANVQRLGFQSFAYGSVVEVQHADCQRLVVLDSYNGTPIAEKPWYRNESRVEIEVTLVRQAARQVAAVVWSRSNMELIIGGVGFVAVGLIVIGLDEFEMDLVENNE